MYNIGVYDVNTNKIVLFWNGVTNVERKGNEVWFTKNGDSRCFSARRGNYLIVTDVEFYEGMDVTPDILSQDQKDQLPKTDDIEQLKEEIRIMQETINFLLGL